MVLTYTHCLILALALIFMFGTGAITGYFTGWSRARAHKPKYRPDRDWGFIPMGVVIFLLWAVICIGIPVLAAHIAHG